MISWSLDLRGAERVPQRSQGREVVKSEVLEGGCSNCLEVILNLIRLDFLERAYR